MPFVSLPERGVRLYARINTSTASAEDDAADARSFIDPDKPCLVLCHVLFISSWMFSTQFADARLLNAFNLIAFDQR